MVTLPPFYLRSAAEASNFLSRDYIHHESGNHHCYLASVYTQAVILHQCHNQDLPHTAVVPLCKNLLLCCIQQLTILKFAIKHYNICIQFEINSLLEEWLLKIDEYLQ